jgi:hypothetical protein
MWSILMRRIAASVKAVAWFGDVRPMGLALGSALVRASTVARDPACGRLRHTRAYIGGWRISGLELNVQRASGNQHIMTLAAT